MTRVFILAAGLFWLLAALQRPRHAAWLLLLWIPVQGWVQLNVFNDAAATVLIYEVAAIGLYLVFGACAVGRWRDFGPPRTLRWAIFFLIWVLLLVPRSITIHGLILTLVALRTYLLPLPLVWIGYRAFSSRVQLETIGWLLMLQAAVIGTVAVFQLGRLSSLSGTIFEAPLGYGVAGVIRPPGTFSAAGHYGMYLLFIVPLAIGLLGLNATFWKRACYAVGLGGGIVGLMANTQRATMVLLAVTVPLLVLLARQRQAVVRTAIAAGVILVGGTIGNLVAGDVFQIRVASIVLDLRSTVVEAPLARLAGAMRTPMWGEALGVASPGVGRLLPQPALSPVRRTVESIRPSESFVPALIYQLGVPGLLLFALFIGVVLGEGLRAVRACRATDMGLLAAAILAYEVAIVIQSWAYDPLHYPPSRVVFWFWAGVLMSLPRLAHEQALPALPVASRSALTPRIVPRGAMTQPWAAQHPALPRPRR